MNDERLNINDKEDELRYAKAHGIIKIRPEVIKNIYDNNIDKGNVLSIAQAAGMMAVKNAANLIPMAVNVQILGSKISFVKNYDNIECICEAQSVGSIDIEMEVITGVSLALITIYEMCKNLDQGMVISEIKLIEKLSGIKNNRIEKKGD
ncbi:MAG: cyclic pyranopterin monophosphate synthase MoaC [Bacilli bacterium]|nr:cyclic pyranopterin monophosphate synthase MoaC [Bacilli bacterium]